jgi:hypothetical protein
MTSGSENGVELIRSANFTAAQVQTSLLAVAMAGGNTKKTAKALKQQDITVTDRTLARWRGETYPKLYAPLCQRHAREIEDPEGASCRGVRPLASPACVLSLPRTHANPEIAGM